jgi:hypothetical protein
MKKNKMNNVVENESGKITVIEEALLKNVVGGALESGEIARMCCCECTGK